MKPTNFIRFFGFLPLALGGPLACRSSDSEPLPPPIPPELSVAELRPLGADAVAADAPCVPVGTDREGTVLVAFDHAGTTSVGDWVLRPPGACAGVRECGFLRATVTDQDAVERVEVLSTTQPVALPLAALLVDGAAGAAGASGLAPGLVNVTVTVSLLGDDSFPIRTAEGDRVETSLDLALAPAGGCPDAAPPPSAGAGGAAGTEAGPSRAGAGGAGGAR